MSMKDINGYLINPEKIVAVSPSFLVLDEQDENYGHYALTLFYEGGELRISLSNGEAVPQSLDPYDAQRAELADARRNELVFQLFGIS